MSSFLTGSLGNLATPVCRLGLSASYWPGKKTIHRAVDEGVNVFFAYGFDLQMISALRSVLGSNRERYVVATGAYNFIWWRQNLRRALEKRLRQLRTGYIDVFHFLGVMKAEQFPPRAQDEMRAIRESGLVRQVAISCHDRKFAGQLAANGVLDTLMIRYNAAHRGAERDIFPFIQAHNTGILSYTATRWRFLLRRPKGWPPERPVPDAGLCYRFVLSHPAVGVCLTAPSSLNQFEANLAAVRRGPLAEDEMAFMREFGDAVYNRNAYFM